MVNGSFPKMRMVTLMNNIGYNVTHENGRLKIGPLSGWTDPPPTAECGIYIGFLFSYVFEADELVAFCNTFGKIYELQISRDCTYVKYTNKEDATNAIKYLDDYEISPGNYIGVCRYFENCRLHIGEIPKNTTKEEIRAEICKYTERLMSVILYKCREDRNFAYIEYESNADAAFSREILLSNPIKINGTAVKIDWAHEEFQVKEETLRRITVLYVQNISNKTTADNILDLFSGSSWKINKLKMWSDIALIYYRKQKHAKIAMEEFNGIFLDGCVIKVGILKLTEAQRDNVFQENDGIFNVFTGLHIWQSLKLSNRSNAPGTFIVTQPIYDRKRIVQDVSETDK